MKSFSELANGVGLFNTQISDDEYAVDKQQIADFYAAMLLECNEVKQSLEEQIYDSVSKSEVRDIG
jgi:hypothetical protein